MTFSHQSRVRVDRAVVLRQRAGRPLSIPFVFRDGRTLGRRVDSWAPWMRALAWTTAWTLGAMRAWIQPLEASGPWDGNISDIDPLLVLASREMLL